LPPEGAPGSAKATVKAKSYRDVLSKVDASPHGAFAILQGKLVSGGVLIDAGLTVQLVVPKESKASV